LFEWFEGRKEKKEEKRREQQPSSPASLPFSLFPRALSPSLSSHGPKPPEAQLLPFPPFLPRGGLRNFLSPARTRASSSGPLAAARSAQPCALPLLPSFLSLARWPRTSAPRPLPPLLLLPRRKGPETSGDLLRLGPARQDAAGRPIKPRRLSRVSPKPPSCPVRANPSPEHRRRRKLRVVAAPAPHRLPPSPKHRGFAPVG
jgi:hypothetical protein